MGHQYFLCLDGHQIPYLCYTGQNVAWLYKSDLIHIIFLNNLNLSKFQAQYKKDHTVQVT